MNQVASAAESTKRTSAANWTIRAAGALAICLSLPTSVMADSQLITAVPTD